MYMQNSTAPCAPELLGDDDAAATGTLSTVLFAAGFCLIKCCTYATHLYQVLFSLTRCVFPARPVAGPVAPRGGVPLPLGHLQAQVSHLRRRVSRAHTYRTPTPSINVRALLSRLCGMYKSTAAYNTTPDPQFKHTFGALRHECAQDPHALSHIIIMYAAVLRNCACTIARHVLVPCFGKVAAEPASGA